MRLLIKSGADINTVTYEITPIIKYLQESRGDLVQYAISNGANINWIISSDLEHSVLEQAVRYQPDMIETLLNAGLKPDPSHQFICALLVDDRMMSDLESESKQYVAGVGPSYLDDYLEMRSDAEKQIPDLIECMRKLGFQLTDSDKTDRCLFNLLKYQTPEQITALGVSRERLGQAVINTLAPFFDVFASRSDGLNKLIKQLNNMGFENEVMQASERMHLKQKTLFGHIEKFIQG